MIQKGIVHQRIGAIFEWAVCQFLAQHKQCEENLLSSLPQNYFQNLEAYQRFIYDFSPEKYNLVMKGAQETAHYIDSLYPNISYTPMPASHCTHREFTEADIFLLGSKQKGISLKFSFNHSFINTKSAGYQSILSSYFMDDGIKEKQLQIALATNHHKLMEELASEFSLKKNFAQQDWLQQKLPTLPGELEGRAKDLLRHYYAALAKDLYGSLELILKENPNYFILGLKKIMGFSDLSTIQVVTQYNKETTTFETKHFDLASSELKIKSMTHKEGTSSVNIEMDSGHMLRLRVKPMDKFTVPGIKVNGALLYK